MLYAYTIEIQCTQKSIPILNFCHFNLVGWCLSSTARESAEDRKFSVGVRQWYSRYCWRGYSQVLFSPADCQTLKTEDWSQLAGIQAQTCKKDTQAEKIREMMFFVIKLEQNHGQFLHYHTQKGKLKGKFCCQWPTPAAVLYTSANETQPYTTGKYVASTGYSKSAHPSASSPRKQAFATKVRALFCAKNRLGQMTQRSIKVLR